MATIASVKTSASSIPSGQTCQVTVVIAAVPPSTVDLAFAIDKSQGNVVVNIPGEAVMYSPDPTQASKPGVLTDLISAGALSNPQLVDNHDGTLTFTATYTAP